MHRLGLTDTIDLVQFIVRNYGKTEKIVEVGVGAYPWVAKGIKEHLPKTRVIVTDIDEEKLCCAKRACSDLDPVCDDVFEPKFNVYKKAELIYSLRPPTEMVSEIIKIASRVGCDVLIRPYSDEEGGYSFLKRDGWRFTSYKKAAFHLMKTNFLKK